MNNMILMSPCERLIPYKEPVFSRTNENTKPAENASKQSRGVRFPACRTPKMVEMKRIPCHLPITRIVLN